MWSTTFFRGTLDSIFLLKLTAVLFILLPLTNTVNQLLFKEKIQVVLNFLNEKQCRKTLNIGKEMAK
jgi:hypothetical protein